MMTSHHALSSHLDEGAFSHWNWLLHKGKS